MDIFKEIRERANILQVCEVLGIKLNRNYKAICPFADHKEKTASFSISPSKNIFCCFGCGKKGNSITLVQELLGISPLESVKYINNNLGLGLELNAPTSYFEINKYKEQRKTEEAFKRWEIETFILLSKYLRLLKRWKDIKDLESELYVEACKQLDYIEYIINEIFIEGTNEDKIWFWKHEKRWIKKIEARIRTFRTTGE